MNSPRNSPQNCYAIPPEKPFVKVLAGWILEKYGLDAAGLPRLLVLLPSRRTCRSLREAFLECSGGKPVLLPRIQPIGDMEDEALLHYPLDSEVSATISPMRRHLLLTKLVMDFKKKQAAGDSGVRFFDVEQAAELAQQLARFMDDVAREGLTMEGLSGLVPDELAIHWQQTLEFLTIISRHWPAMLAEEGAIDPVEQRNRQLLATAKAWQQHPPETPVIAAGSTGSMPATAKLLATIARLPEGMVVLPGLDTAMPEAEWKTVTETHPQFGLKQLLDTMGCKRSDVKELSGGQATAQPERISVLRAFFQSPEATSGWLQSTAPMAEGLHGVSLLTAETLLDEARTIAIALREVLETPGKTAALVTPDRTLARMVASQMQRFGIEIDDSAGHVLADTPAGCFMALLAEMVSTAAAPVPLLSLLRHPLAAAGRDTAECRRLSRLLETEMLRGLRRNPGLDALREAANVPPLKQFLSDLAAGMKPLQDCFHKREVPLQDLLQAHVACAEWLASTNTQDGPSRLWAGDAGNRVAALIAESAQHAGVLGAIDPSSYAGLFRQLLAGHSYYPQFGMHPRLHILSPMEARLLRFDKVILGSLNEGTWPTPSEIDPWMSRPMRSSFGLPATERSIGQSAHDVFMQCASGEVLLSRARKVDGAPTVPSRWLVRMETLVKGMDAATYESLHKDEYYASARQLLEQPVAMKPLERPEPRPPLEARPRQLRVTAIDKWLRDPYAIYAQYVLGLRKLDGLDEEPDAADFGNVVHKALELFTGAWPQSLPANAMDELLRCGRTAFAGMMDRPAVACLWWPRFEAMCGWLIGQEKARRGTLLRVMAELKGRWEFKVDGMPFTLTTKIDRLETSRDGSMVIADYKTGSVPTPSDIDDGLANQLFLEALVAMHGVLEPAVTPAAVSGLEYWKLAGRAEKCDIMQVGVGGIEAARSRLENLIRRYSRPDEPYAAARDISDREEQYNDFQHLTRRQEWGDA